MERTSGRRLSHQQVGGMAALYLAAAYLATMPYFLLVLDYPSVVDPAAKLALLVAHQGSLYAFNLLAYVVFGLVLTVLALALHDRLAGETPAMARVVAGWGIIWSCLLIASGTASNMGMEYVVWLGLVAIISCRHADPDSAVLDAMPGLRVRSATLALMTGQTSGVEEKLQAAERALHGVEQ